MVQQPFSPPPHRIDYRQNSGRCFQVCTIFLRISYVKFHVQTSGWTELLQENLQALLDIKL